jgi:hypothetical protein
MYGNDRDNDEKIAQERLRGGWVPLAGPVAAGSTIVPAITTIQDLWIALPNGTRATSLPQGADFDVHVAFDANISYALITTWSVCITVIDVNDPTIKNFANIDSILSAPGSQIKRSDLTLNHLGQLTMPNHALSLRIKVWGTSGETPSPLSPDPSLW